MTDTSSYPIPGSASSMTPERRLWMRAVLSCEEAGNPGVAWHEWLGSALLALDSAVLRDPLTATWMDGLPPADVFVWREVDGFDHPVRTGYRSGALSFISAHDPGGWQPWGTARWAPIPKPSDKVPVVQATPAQSPTVVLDSMTVEQIEAYLNQRKEQEWLARGCGDGFERLLVELDFGSIVLRDGCRVWRDDTNTIRRAFGWCSAPAWSHDRLCWVTFDDEERMIPASRPLFRWMSA